MKRFWITASRAGWLDGDISVAEEFFNGKYRVVVFQSYNNEGLDAPCHRVIACKDVTQMHKEYVKCWKQLNDAFGKPDFNIYRRAA